MAKKSTSKKAREAESKVSPNGETTKPETASAKKAAKKSANKAPKKAAKKSAVKKAAAPEAGANKPAPKEAAKKTVAKKTAAKKSSAKKTAAKKSAPIETTPSARKTTRAAARKASAKAAKSAQPARSVLGEPDTAPKGRISARPKAPAAPPSESQRIAYRRAQSSPEVFQHTARPVDIPDLPDRYDRTFVAVLVRDSDWVFVYWEISDALRAELGLESGRQHALTLRLFDVTGLGGDTNRAHSKTDIPVHDQANSWYVHIPRSGRDYVLELGASQGGVYHFIARSSLFSMPRHQLSNDFDWYEGSEEYENHDQILRMSGGVSVSSHISSAEFLGELQKRLSEQMSSISGAGFSGELLGSEFAQRVLAQQEITERERGFWLVVDTEVIVYGATEPNAKVRLMGRDIRLNPDGTFGIRMALPNGTIEFPVEATSPDGEEVRRVKPIVVRRTD